jgi:hypothetical protein
MIVKEACLRVWLRNHEISGDDIFLPGMMSREQTAAGTPANLSKIASQRKRGLSSC